MSLTEAFSFSTVSIVAPSKSGPTSDFIAMNQNGPTIRGARPTQGAASDRKARLAAELRENLKKRKAQQRKRQDSGPPQTAPEGGEAPGPDKGD